MRRPYVITHALISVDGRLAGFPPEVTRYYELAGRLPHDVVLSGSGTMVAAATDAGIDLSEDAQSEQPAAAALSAGTDRPLLVVVDSRGRLTRFDWIRRTGLFGDVMVLGSASTPPDHHARLRAAGVRLEVHGERRVDLAAALQRLQEAYGVETVRVDAGPGLNSALLAANLLDEISLLLAPWLVGHGPSFLEEAVGRRARRLELISAEPLSDGHTWLRYAVQPDV